MKEAKRWNFKLERYEPCGIWDTSRVIAQDMDTPTRCAQCGKVFRFGDMYTSTQIHNYSGWGYAVCARCLDAEMREREEANLHGGDNDAKG